MDISSFWAALQNRQWSIVAAFVVWLAIALAKQGWASAWLASKLPSALLPYLAVLLSIGGLYATEVTTGTPWVKALTDGILAGLGAVFFHETIVEGLRGGKEVVPARAPRRAKADPSLARTDPGGGTPPDGPPDPS